MVRMCLRLEKSFSWWINQKSRRTVYGDDKQLACRKGPFSTICCSVNTSALNGTILQYRKCLGWNFESDIHFYSYYRNMNKTDTCHSYFSLKIIHFDRFQILSRIIPINLTTLHHVLEGLRAVVHFRTFTRII